MNQIPYGLDPTLLKAAADFLDGGDDFLLSAHVNSDGDAVGACLGLQRLLQIRGKRATVVLSDLQDQYDFIPGWTGIKVAPQAHDGRRFSHVVVLDCPQLGRVGRVEAYMAEDAQVLNIDHHPDNSAFGHINLVPDGASSSCEILYHLAVFMEIAFDQDLAEQLYSGIVYDTGSFRYSLATATTFAVAGQLVAYGARLDYIARRLFSTKSFDEVKVMGRAIDSLELHFDQRVAVLHVGHEDMRYGSADEVVNYGLMVDCVELAVLLKEDAPSQYRISLRSLKADVQRIAAVFDGGGHAKAAGCRINGLQADVKARLLAEIEKHLE
jgi:phosphoesterase RecJ-like protein